MQSPKRGGGYHGEDHAQRGDDVVEQHHPDLLPFVVRQRLLDLVDHLPQARTRTLEPCAVWRVRCGVRVLCVLPAGRWDGCRCGLRRCPPSAGAARTGGSS